MFQLWCWWHFFSLLVINPQWKWKKTLMERCFRLTRLTEFPAHSSKTLPATTSNFFSHPRKEKKKLSPRFSILAISKFHVIYEKSIQKQISMAGSYSHGTWLVTGPRVVSSVSLRTKERSKAKISCSAAEKTLDMEAKKSTDYRCGKKKSWRVKRR